MIGSDLQADNLGRGVHREIWMFTFDQSAREPAQLNVLFRDRLLLALLRLPRHGAPVWKTCVEDPLKTLILLGFMVMVGQRQLPKNPICSKITNLPRFSPTSQS